MLDKIVDLTTPCINLPDNKPFSNTIVLVFNRQLYPEVLQHLAVRTDGLPTRFRIYDGIVEIGQDRKIWVLYCRSEEDAWRCFLGGQYSHAFVPDNSSQELKNRVLSRLRLSPGKVYTYKESDYV